MDELPEHPLNERGKYKKGDGTTKPRTWYSRFELVTRSFRCMMARCLVSASCQKDGKTRRCHGHKKHFPNSYSTRQQIQAGPEFLDATPETHVIQDTVRVKVGPNQYEIELRPKKRTRTKGFWVFFKQMEWRPYPEAHVDRIITEVTGPLPDGEGHYTLDNIEWSSPENNMRRKTNNRKITALYRGDEQEHVLALWAKITGIPAQVIADRIDNQGMTPTEAVNTKWKSLKKPRKDTNGQAADPDQPVVPPGGEGQAEELP